MKVYTVNKKIKRYLARKSHTFSPKWETYKKKRWILCYGGVLIPCILSLILFLYFMIQREPLDAAIVNGIILGHISGVVTWPIAIINYKIMLLNCGYVDGGSFTDELILDEEKMIFSYPPDSNGVRIKETIYFCDVKEIWYQEKAYTLHMRCDYIFEYYSGSRKMGRRLAEDTWIRDAIYYNDHEEAVEYIMNHVSCKGERR